MPKCQVVISRVKSLTLQVVCFLEVLASQGASCEVWLSLWVRVWHHTAFAGGLESWQCGHREWAVFTQWWQDAPRRDGCLTSVQRTGSTCFYIISTEQAAPSSLPRQLQCVSPQPTACLTHFSPNLLDANDREDARAPGTSLIACSVVTFCYPGTWPEFHSMPHVPGTRRTLVWSAGPSWLPACVSAMLARYFRCPGGSQCPLAGA